MNNFIFDETRLLLYGDYKMYKTKVFATSEEIEAVKSTAKQPLIALQCGNPRSAQEHVHDLALTHGLPEQSGFYGMDLKTGEFLSQYEVEIT